MTHSEMVRRARNWLWSLSPTPERARPLVVCTETSSSRSAENPDVFGVGPDGLTYLIECKVSRADFLADRSKSHRSDPLHLGNYRWFCAPSGIIEPHELPNGWGLVQVVGSKLIERIAAQHATDVDREAELSIMVGVMQRVWRGGRVRGVGMRTYSRTRSADRWVWETPLAPGLDENYPKFSSTVGVEP
ncbi:MAG: hypothetical protein J5I53_10900 [Bradyrhizobiaceae bacterium]|nr:hypothetical protein [Bradyrhizobiaceae bacterium]